jgi:hypothetical protein
MIIYRLRGMEVAVTLREREFFGNRETELI